MAELGLPTSEIHHYFWGGYWDGPISGWLYTRGRFYRFDLLNDVGDYYRLYGVYAVPKAIRVPHLARHRSFCHEVGWHCNRRPGEEKRRFNGEAKPHWEAWFDRAKPELPEIPSSRLIGVTTLREGHVHWFDELANRSRDWVFIEDDDDDEAVSPLSIGKGCGK